MIKKFPYIFIFLSVIITVSHSIIAHHHHFDTSIEEANHYHDDDEQDHSMFSFGQLDESFIFSHSNLTLSNEASTTLFLIPTNPLLVPINYTIGCTDFITHKEFPPPEDYFHSASYRGPPTV